VRGRREGEGTMRYATGQESVGIWSDGALVSETTGSE